VIRSARSPYHSVLPESSPAPEVALGVQAPMASTGIEAEMGEQS